MGGAGYMTCICGQRWSGRMAALWLHRPGWLVAGLSGREVCVTAVLSRTHRSAHT
jgi:hypothetical protein